MTRARDELILTHAADYGGTRVRRVSPFVLEALDLPSAAGDRRERRPSARSAGAAGRVRDRGRGRRARRSSPIDEPLTLSFGQIDDYLTCPQKFKYQHVLRVPVAPHHAMIYGSALHKAVQEFHRRHARGDVMSEAELVDAFEVAWRNEGFLTREHEEARLEAGRAALRRFRAEQLQPGAVIPAYVEREFSFTLNGDRIRGRWDRVDIEPVVGDRIAASSSERRRAPVRAIAGRRPSSPTSCRHAAAAAARARHDHGLQVERRPRSGRRAAAGPGLAPADDLRDGLPGADRPPAGRGPAPLPGVGPRSVGPRSTIGASRRARPRSRGRRGDPCPRLHGPPGPALVQLLSVPRHLPVQRRPVKARRTRRPSKRSRSTSGTRSSRCATRCSVASSS